MTRKSRFDLEILKTLFEKGVRPGLHQFFVTARVIDLRIVEFDAGTVGRLDQRIRAAALYDCSVCDDAGHSTHGFYFVSPDAVAMANATRASVVRGETRNMYMARFQVSKILHLERPQFAVVNRSAYVAVDLEKLEMTPSPSRHSEKQGDL